jgi:proteasome lid subunit RPN8/RPN11
MTYKWEAIAQDLTEERDGLLKALNELADKAVRLSDRLHEEEVCGVIFGHYTDAAWEEMSIAIEEARAALKSEKQ